MLICNPCLGFLWISVFFFAIFSTLAPFLHAQLTESQIQELRVLEKELLEINGLAAKGHYAHAIPRLERVIETLREVLGKDDGAIAGRSMDLAAMLCYEGRYQDAIPRFEEAIRLNQPFAKEFPAEHADLLKAFSTCLSKAAQPKKAVEVILQALVLAKQAHGADSMQFSSFLNDAGFYLRAMARLDEAESYYRRALEVRQRVPDCSPQALARAHNNLGELLIAKGEFAKARGELEKAVAILKVIKPPQKLMLADSLNNLGYLAKQQADYETAISRYDESLALLQANLPQQHLSIGRVLNNKGSARMRQGKYAEAIALLVEAFEIITANLGGQSSEAANVLSLAGECLLRLSKPDLARTSALEAFEIRSQVLGWSHPNTGWSAYDVGVASTYLGDIENANKYFAIALKSLDQSLSPTHIGRAALHSGIATHMASQGQLNPAKGCFDIAQQIIVEHARLVLPTLADVERWIYADRMMNNLQRGLSFAFDNRTDQSIVDTSAVWLANGKEIVTETHAMQTRLLLLAGDANSNANDLRKIREELAGFSMLDTKELQNTAYVDRIKRLTDEDARLTRELAIELQVEQAPAVVRELDAVRRIIPNKSILVDIALVTPSRFNLKTLNYESDPARYLAWVMPPKSDVPVKLIDLGLAETIDGLIVDIREQLKGDSKRGAIVEGGGELHVTNRINDKLQRLADFLYQPLAEYLEDADDLIISPDGSLWLVPWAALPVSSSDLLLIEKHSLSFISTTRSLLSNQEHYPKGIGEFIFADPDYDADIDSLVGEKTPRLDSRGAHLSEATRLFGNVERLEAAASEANAILSFLAETEGAMPVVFLREQANELKVKAIKNPNSLILITHGFFLDDGPTSTLAPPISSSALDRQGSDVTAGARIANPFLRCGLMLSGCNSRISQTNNALTVLNNDGVLTGLEILGMDLRGTNLVFLGACDTGTGRVRANEGIAGLRQAFQIAGAETVVATLWPVDHIETQRLSIAFFQHLRDGSPPKDALRLAQLERIQERRDNFGAAHPYFWAGVTVTGN
jgi:CHAT domain-containing protein/Tfp pilus assembly protein PilF